MYYNEEILGSFIKLSPFTVVQGHISIIKLQNAGSFVCVNICFLSMLLFIIQECAGQLIMCCLAASPDLNLQSFELVLSNFGKAENLQVNHHALCYVGFDLCNTTAICWMSLQYTQKGTQDGML